MKEQSWFDAEEAFLAKIEKQCNSYNKHYSQEYTFYNKLSSRFNIPILVVSAVNALTAVALNSFIPQEYVSVMNAILSAGTGVLGSIQLYLKLNEKMTKALSSSMLMKRLALKISKELSIDRDQRVTDGQAFLQECFAEFNTAIEQGNPIEKNLANHVTINPEEPKSKGGLTGFVARMGTPRAKNEESLRTVGTRAKMLWGTIQNTPSEISDDLNEIYVSSNIHGGS
jgi:hypothetical protein